MSAPRAKALYLDFDRFVGQWVISFDAVEMNQEDRDEFYKAVEQLDAATDRLQKICYEIAGEK